MIKRLTLSVVCIPVFFALTSCIDEQNDLGSQRCNGSCTTVAGVITTDDGKQPLAGVEVVAIWKNTGYLFGGTIRTKAKTVTDSFGNYQLRFEVSAEESEAGYFIFEVLTNKEYFKCTDENTSFEAFKLYNDSLLTKDLFIPYKSHLTISAVGAEKMKSNDYFSLEISPVTSVGVKGNTCGQVLGWSNRDPNWIYEIDVPANLNLVVRTVINEGNGYERSYDTLFIDKGKSESYTAVFK